MFSDRTLKKIKLIGLPLFFSLGFFLVVTEYAINHPLRSLFLLSFALVAASTVVLARALTSGVESTPVYLISLISLIVSFVLGISIGKFFYNNVQLFALPVKNPTTVEESMQNFSVSEQLPPTTKNMPEEFKFYGDAAYWADRVVSGEGAFILYFRHAEREEWPLVLTYDFFEISEGIEGREQTYASAVCLSKRGIEDALIIGKTLKYLEIPITRVLSSPSCRARETATLAMGRIDEIDTGFVHLTAVPDSQREQFSKRLRDALIRNKPTEGNYVIIFGQGSTLMENSSIVFPNFTGTLTEPEESGLYLIEYSNDEFLPRWVFTNFQDFSRNLLKY